MHVDLKSLEWVWFRKVEKLGWKKYPVLILMKNQSELGQSDFRFIAVSFKIRQHQFKKIFPTVLVICSVPIDFASFLPPFKCEIPQRTSVTTFKSWRQSKLTEWVIYVSCGFLSNLVKMYQTKRFMKLGVVKIHWQLHHKQFKTHFERSVSPNISELPSFSSVVLFSA